MTERMKFCVFFSFSVFLSVAQASTSDTFAIVTSWSGFVFVHDGAAEQLVALIRTESKVSPLPFRPEAPVPYTYTGSNTHFRQTCVALQFRADKRNGNCTCVRPWLGECNKRRLCIFHFVGNHIQVLSRSLLRCSELMAKHEDSN